MASPIAAGGVQVSSLRSNWPQQKSRISIKYQYASWAPGFFNEKGHPPHYSLCQILSLSLSALIMKKGTSLFVCIFCLCNADNQCCWCNCRAQSMAAAMDLGMRLKEGRKYIHDSVGYLLDFIGTGSIPSRIRTHSRNRKPSHAPVCLQVTEVSHGWSGSLSIHQYSSNSRLQRLEFN